MHSNSRCLYIRLQQQWQHEHIAFDKSAQFSGFNFRSAMKKSGKKLKKKQTVSVIFLCKSVLFKCCKCIVKLNSKILSYFKIKQVQTKTLIESM